MSRFASRAPKRAGDDATSSSSTSYQKKGKPSSYSIPEHVCITMNMLKKVYKFIDLEPANKIHYFTIPGEHIDPQYKGKVFKTIRLLQMDVQCPSGIKRWAPTETIKEGLTLDTILSDEDKNFFENEFLPHVRTLMFKHCAALYPKKAALYEKQGQEFFLESIKGEMSQWFSPEFVPEEGEDGTTYATIPPKMKWKVAMNGDANDCPIMTCFDEKNENVYQLEDRLQEWQKKPEVEKENQALYDKSIAEFLKLHPKREETVKVSKKGKEEVRVFTSIVPPYGTFNITGILLGVFIGKEWTISTKFEMSHLLVRPKEYVKQQVKIGVKKSLPAFLTNSVSSATQNEVNSDVSHSEGTGSAQTAAVHVPAHAPAPAETVSSTAASTPQVANKDDKQTDAERDEKKQ